MGLRKCSPKGDKEAVGRPDGEFPIVLGPKF